MEINLQLVLSIHLWFKINSVNVAAWVSKSYIGGPHSLLSGLNSVSLRVWRIFIDSACNNHVSTDNHRKSTNFTS